MESLVSWPQSSQDTDCLLDGRFRDSDGLEATLERGVTFHDAFEVILSRSSDDLDFAAREDWLEQIGSIYGAFGATPTEQRLKLIYEENDTLRAQQFIHDALEALFEVTSVFCSNGKQADIQGDDTQVVQGGRGGATGDTLRQALGDGCFPTPAAPTSTGLFLRRRVSVCMVCTNSRSRPISGSSAPSRAAEVRSRLTRLSAGVSW